MTTLDDLIRDAGSVGMIRTVVTRKADPTDIICGYFGTDDVNYGLRMLISCFEKQKQAQPFKVGDRVRVRKEFWYLGDNNNGWSGFAPMFADATGTVTEVAWSPGHESWYLLVEYQHPYRWSDYTQDFNVKDHPSSFMFNLEHVKKVGKHCD